MDELESEGFTLGDDVESGQQVDLATFLSSYGSAASQSQFGAFQGSPLAFSEDVIEGLLSCSDTTSPSESPQATFLLEDGDLKFLSEVPLYLSSLIIEFGMRRQRQVL